MSGEELGNSTSSITQQSTNPNPNPNTTSVEATIQSSSAVNATESTCNTTTSVYDDVDREKTLEFADELFEDGLKAVLVDNDYAEAADCFSRTLEIRVAHYGELAIECVSAYYQYGRALLYKSQEESDPLGSVPKKKEEEKEADKDDVGVKGIVVNGNGESSVASVSSINGNDQAGSSNPQEEEAVHDATDGKDDEEDSGDTDADEGEEDESDLDLAWKMLDLARAISEKHSADTVETVDILSALAEASLEREDIETALSDYQKALVMLERIVEPDSRQIAALNFQISLCLELGSRAQEAIPYCEKAISICKSRMQRFANEVKSSLEPAKSSTISEVDDGVQQSSNGIQTDKTTTEKDSEVEALTGLLGELEKKLEDLQQLAANPKSYLSEFLDILPSKAGGGEKSTPALVPAIGTSQMGVADSSNGFGFDSPTVSTAHTPATVTHLGVVGRGVKRMATNSSSTESPSKKVATSGKGEGSTS